MDSMTFAFEVTIKGHLTCDKDELANVARDKRVAKVAVAADYVARAIHDMARPGTGPLAFEEVTASTRHIRFTE